MNYPQNLFTLHPLGSPYFYPQQLPPYDAPNICYPNLNLPYLPQHGNFFYFNAPEIQPKKKQ